MRDGVIYGLFSIFQELKEKGYDITLTGSRAICQPPPVGTDIDYLVYGPAGIDQFLHDGGFEQGSAEQYPNQVYNFKAWRKGEVNLIVTHNTEFAENHKKAMVYCRERNLLNKADRIEVFQAYLYGKALTIS